MLKLKTETIFLFGLICLLRTSGSHIFTGASILTQYPQFNLICSAVVNGADYNSSLTVDKITNLCSTACLCAHGARNGGKCAKIPGTKDDYNCLCDYSKPLDDIPMKDNPICKAFPYVLLCGTPLQELTNDILCKSDCRINSYVTGKCMKLPWDPEGTYCICGKYIQENNQSLINPLDGSLISLVSGGGV